MRWVTAIAMAMGAWIGSSSAAPALVRIDVDLGAQKMSVAADSGENFQWPISSGAAGRETPRGTFRPTALYPMVYSWKYGNEPMPHSIFFYGQYAIHGTMEVDDLGRPASHGCIRLAPSDAAILYALVSREGALIRISGEPESADPSAPSGGGLWEGWAAEPLSAR
ncbi:MAG: L,D-transpeptidase [Roseiarcus sp.]|jgi:lipoprotein-anchoring transpeptidase ErfK/SrfK